MYATTTTATSDDIEAEFRRLDVNKDGYVCKNDMLASSLKKEDIVEILEAYDFDRDGKLCFTEFQALCEDEDEDSDTSSEEWDADDSEDDAEAWHRMSKEYDDMDDDFDNDDSASSTSKLSVWHDSDDESNFDACDLDGDGLVSPLDMSKYFQIDMRESKHIIASFDNHGDEGSFATMKGADISAQQGGLLTHCLFHLPGNVRQSCGRQIFQWGKG